MSSRTYSDVGALLIRWDDELDTDLKCKEEVDELDKLFKEKYGFDTSVVKLTSSPNPQQQLLDAMAELIPRYDGPSDSHLLIIYYSGHSKINRHGELDFRGAPVNPMSYESSVQQPTACLLAGEDGLRRTQADMLLILDCCCASSFVETDARVPDASQDRIYEILAASGRRQVAEQPGERSFTRRMIDVLKDELKREDGQGISTYELNDEVSRRRIRLSPIESRLMNRYANVRGRNHIVLAPIKHEGEVADAKGLEALPKSHKPFPAEAVCSIIHQFGYQEKLTTTDLKKGT